MVSAGHDRPETIKIPDDLCRAAGTDHRGYPRRVTLQCPATLLVARHGEADYEQPGVLSDEGGWLTPRGREQVSELASRLAQRRIAAVYSSRLERALESAALASDSLGVTTTQVDGLHEFLAGDLAGRREGDPGLLAMFFAWLAAGADTPVPGGAETGTSVIHRYRDALGGIADLHRGETVLVISHGGVMSYVLPRVGRNVPNDLAGRGYLPNCALVEVAADDDGFDIVSWPEMADWPAPAPAPQPPG